MDYDQAASCRESLAQWAHVRIACAKLKQSQLFERDAFTELNDTLNTLFIFQTCIVNAVSQNFNYLNISII